MPARNCWGIGALGNWGVGALDVVRGTNERTVCSVQCAGDEERQDEDEVRDDNKPHRWAGRRGEATNLREQEQMRAFAWMNDWVGLVWRSFHSEQLADPRVGWEYGVKSRRA